MIPYKVLENNDEAPILTYMEVQDEYLVGMYMQLTWEALATESTRMCQQTQVWDICEEWSEMGHHHWERTW